VRRACRIGSAAHLPSLVALVLAMAAAAASYSVYVDRAASSRHNARELAEPAAQRDHRHSGSHTPRKKHRHHHQRASNPKAHYERPQRVPATVVVTRVVERRCDLPRSTSRAAPTAKQPAAAHTDTERAVDRELQDVIDQEIPARAQP
jgi:hypothetical protein